MEDGEDMEIGESVMPRVVKAIRNAAGHVTGRHPPMVEVIAKDK